MAVMALSLLVACGGSATQTLPDGKEEAVVERKDVFKSGAEIYEEAAAKLRNIGSEEELELVETEIQNALETLENSVEMAEYLSCVNSGDSLAIQEYEASMKRLEDAAAEYSAALLDAYIKCSR